MTREGKGQEEGEENTPVEKPSKLGEGTSRGGGDIMNAGMEQGGSGAPVSTKGIEQEVEPK